MENPSDNLPSREDPTLLHRFLKIVLESPDHPMMEAWVPERASGLSPHPISYGKAFFGICRRERLIREKISPGETLVALVAPPGVEWVLWDFAIMMAGKTVVPIDHLQSVPVVREILGTFGIGTVVTYGTGLGEELKGSGLLIFGPGGTDEDLSGTGSPGVADEVSRVRRTLPKDPGFVAHLLLTSGTTGKPKGVPLTHENLLFDCDRVLEGKIYRKGDRVLCVLPLHHSYPYMVNILLPLSVGGTILFPPDLAPATLREILSRGRISLFPAVPALWESFHRKIHEEIDKRSPPVRWLVRSVLLPASLLLRERFGIDIGGVLFSSVRNRFGHSMHALSSGGAALRPEVARDFIAMGLNLLEGYGLTETSPVATMNVPGAFRIGSVGRPLKGVEVRVDPPLEDRPGGMVRIRGKNVAASYWESREKRRPLQDDDGWFETGDLGFLRDGFLFLVGREKEVIVLPNGKNIFAEPLERLLSRSPGIAEAAVLLEGNALVALFRPEGEGEEGNVPGGNLPPPDFFRILESVNLTLPSHSRIAAFETVRDPLPRTRLGKLRRFLLPDLYRDSRRERIGRFPSMEETEGRGESLPLFQARFGEKVREMLREVSGLPGGAKGPIEDGMNLAADLGIDSLGQIDLLQKIEEELGQPVPDEFLGEIRTVGDLLAHLVLLLPEPSRERGGLSDSILNRPLDPEEESLIPPRGREDRGALSFREDLLFWTLRFLGRILFRIHWPEISAGDFPSGPFVLVANHTSYLDGLVLALCLPRKVLARTLFWGFAPLFDGPLRPFRTLFGIVSIDSSQARSGLRIALRLLRRGRSLGIFPEGERSVDGRLARFRPGVGLILSRTGVPVVPVGLAGVYAAYPPHRRFPRPGKIGIRIGSPIGPGTYTGLSDQAIADRLEGEVRRLLTDVREGRH